MRSRIKIEAAKHANLPALLQRMGVDVIAEGRSYHLRDHDSLKFFRQNGVWLYKWWSRGGEVGDGVQYLQRYCGMGFKEAIDTLTGGTVFNENDCRSASWTFQKRVPFYKGPKEWASDEWQNKSQKLIRVARSYLLHGHGGKRLPFLVHERGLQLETIKKRRLGWLPEKNGMPSKIVIPCYTNKGALIRIRFRLDSPMQERYRLSRGSNAHLPFPLGISYNKPVVIVESELDAMLVAQEADGRVGVLGLGSTGAKFSLEMIRFLNENVSKILISLDNDRSGIKRTANLMKTLRNAINWPVPQKYGKDPGEAWKRMNLLHWIERGVKSNSKIKR